MDRKQPQPPMACPDLFRAARAALDWSLVQASRRAGLSISVVHAAEGRGAASASVPAATVEDLRRAYEVAGVSFFDDGAVGRGIRVVPR